MRLLILVICSLSLLLSGCAKIIPFEPRPLRVELFKPYKSNASVQIINVSDKGVFQIIWPINYDQKVSSQRLVDVLGDKLSKSGVRIDDKSNKSLKISLEKLVGLNKTGVGINPCEAQITVEMGNSELKQVFTRDASRYLLNSCEFALAKAVAEIYNDEQIRAYIDGKPYGAESNKKNVTTGGDSAEERLEKLKALLDKGLISQNQFDKKSDEILSKM